MNATIRKITKLDNVEMASIIRTVMPEFGAGGAGFAIHDTEVDSLYESYNHPGHVYFVCEYNGKLAGGGGVGPLQGGDDGYCELKKMYFLSAARGKGLGQQTLLACIQSAKALGYTHCYLETFNTMTDAMRLYEKVSFKKVDGPLGNTGHFACDKFYCLAL